MRIVELILDEEIGWWRWWKKRGEKINTKGKEDVRSIQQSEKR